MGKLVTLLGVLSLLQHFQEQQPTILQFLYGLPSLQTKPLNV